MLVCVVCVYVPCACVRVVCVLCVLVCVLLPILTHVIRVFIKWTSGGAERAAYVRTTYSIECEDVSCDGRR